MRSMSIIRARSRGDVTAHFLRSISSYYSDACDISAQPVTISRENTVGHIERISRDASGLLWVCGWSKVGIALTSPGVIIDKRKYPCVLAAVAYPRADLPKDSLGFCGVLQTDWIPSWSSEDVFLAFGNGLHLQVSRPIAFVDHSEMAELFHSVRTQCFGENAVALNDLLSSIGNWAVVKQNSDFAAEASVDSILFLEGFGLLLEGWVISPSKRPVTLLLHVAGSVAKPKNYHLNFKPRPDLAGNVLNANALMCETAGLTGVILGKWERCSIEPVLKIVYEDGSSSNHPFDLSRVRTIGHSATLDDAARMMPSLLSESWFSRFAKSYQRTIRKRIATPHIMHRSSAKQKDALIRVLPDSESDAILVLEDTLRNCANVDSPFSTIFIIQNTAIKFKIVNWLEEAGIRQASALVLAVTSSHEHTFYELPLLLAELKLERFVFVDHTILLHEAGYHSIRKYLTLTQSRETLTFFEIMDENKGSDDRFSASCFGWTTAHFTRWIRRVPFLIGGALPEEKLKIVDPKAIRPRSARRLERRFTRRIHECINLQLMPLVEITSRKTD